MGYPPSYSTSARSCGSAARAAGAEKPACGCFSVAPATINGQFQGRPSGALPLELIPTARITRTVIVARPPAAGFSALLHRAALRAASPHDLALVEYTHGHSGARRPSRPGWRGCERQVCVKADVSRRGTDRIKRTRSLRTAWGQRFLVIINRRRRLPSPTPTCRHGNGD
jgi:hypothetical protein